MVKRREEFHPKSYPGGKYPQSPEEAISQKAFVGRGFSRDI
jgi:hypothetical protein